MKNYVLVIDGDLNNCWLVILNACTYQNDGTALPMIWRSALPERRHLCSVYSA